MSQLTSFPIDCFDRRPIDQINEDIKLSTNSIDILQMDVESIRKDHSDSIHMALESKKNLHVRILTLDPSSPYIARRAHQLGITFAEHRQQTHKSIRELISGFDGYNFFLQVYDDYPTQITFSIDESIYVSTIALNRRSRELCTFKLHRESPGADRSFGFQFDSIWATSREYQ